MAYLNGHMALASLRGGYRNIGFPYSFSDIFKRPTRRTSRRRRKQTQSNYDGGYRHPMRWIGWVVFALVLVALIGFLGDIAYRGFGPMATYGGYPFFGWFFFPFGFIFFFIFIFFIFRVAFWGFGGWGWRRRYWYGYGYSDAHEILRQRYAKGEITKDQYDQMTRDLEQH